MKLFTKEIERKLLANHKENETRSCYMVKHKPVVKFFGGSSCTWLISEMDEDGLMFGLCDLGHGTPELGCVHRQELENVRFKPFNLPVERDRYFKADKTLDEYADEARKHGRIIT